VSHNPLFQVAFSFHDAPLCDLRLPGMQLAVTDLIDNGSAKFDMNVVVIPRREQGVGHRATAADGITVIWEYNTDLFDPDTVRAMIDRYVRLLDAVAAAPARRLSELTALDQRELDRLHAWNDTRTPISRSGLLQAFAAMVQATPGAPAIVTRDEHLTYSDLDRRSNRLARFLVESGHAPDTVIGLSMRRSARVLTTLLGVRKAGAAYLPLDPDLPPRRLAAVLDDAQARLLLTDASFAHAGAIATPILDLEREWPRIEMCSDIALSRPFDAQAPAYVIYTSGSTGRPKGVAVSHGALANALAGLRAVIRPTRRDRMFAVTSLAFDIAALELFVPLITGASCWIASRTIGGGATVLDEWAASGATLLQATPSGWRALLDQGWTGGPALKAMSGGEPLPAALARELLRHSGSLLTLNGPTETTIYSTTHRVGPLDAPISIGRPIANTHTYVVDRLLQPVPPGAIGELVIGGTSVALGYWRRPGATAAAFVPDLFAHAPGRRLYRTGDLVRQHRDGTFEFIGRRDAQLKVHGYRIEPGEIEAALRDQPGIHDAVVVARGDGHDAQLVAYIVTDAPPADDQRPARTAALVALLKTRLPDYMVPRAMVWLDALPLTLSGKVNRAALPAPAPPAAHIAVAPRTPTEAAMAAIWREVLGSDEVGVHDHFFALGGHSLIALQIVSRTWRALGVEIPLQVVFDSPTIAEMAIVVDQYRSAESAATLAS
jgi:amino acid adenylation domain-containing protein